MPPALGRALAVIAARPVPHPRPGGCRNHTYLCNIGGAGPGSRPAGRGAANISGGPSMALQKRALLATATASSLPSPCRYCCPPVPRRHLRPAGSAPLPRGRRSRWSRQHRRQPPRPSAMRCREPCAGSTAKQGRWLGNRRASWTNWPARCGRHRAIATEGSARTYRLWQSSRRRCDPAHDPPTRVSLVAQTRPIFSR